MNFLRKILEYLRGEPQHIGKLYERGLKTGKNFIRMGGGSHRPIALLSHYDRR